MSLLYFRRPSECASLSGLSIWSGERGGRAPFYLSDWLSPLGSWGEHCVCDIWKFIRGFPWAGGKAGCISPRSPALNFIQRRAVTLFICLRIGFPHKSLFEVGFLWLSSVSTSVCQQAGSGLAPANTDPYIHSTQKSNGATGRLSSVTFQWNLALFSLGPCYVYHIFIVYIPPCVCYNEKILIRSVFIPLISSLCSVSFEAVTPMFFFSPCFLVLITRYL